MTQAAKAGVGGRRKVAAAMMVKSGCMGWSFFGSSKLKGESLTRQRMLTRTIDSNQMALQCAVRFYGPVNSMRLSREIEVHRADDDTRMF